MKSHLIIDKEASLKNNEAAIVAACRKVEDMILNEFDGRGQEIEEVLETDTEEIKNKRELYHACERIIRSYSVNLVLDKTDYFTLSLICSTNAEFQRALAKDASRAATLLSTLAKTFAAKDEE